MVVRIVEVGYLLYVLLCFGHVGLEESVEQVVDVVRVFGHAVAEGIVSVGGEAKQLGYLSVFIDYLAYYVSIVVVSWLEGE